MRDTWIGWGRTALLTLVAGAASTAHGATFMVTTTADSGAGSLRQAIMDANADAAADVIEFAIGSGHQAISPTSVLPAVIHPVTIDGTTQPGYASAPLIELDGTNVPPGLSGIALVGHTGSTVRGLVVNNFAVDYQTGGNGILLQNGGGHTIEGNYLGTDATGTMARPNGRYGIACQGCANCTIGGTTAAARNLLSGNLDAGILVSDGAGNVIEGNWIGLDATGTAALGNDDGIFMLDTSVNNTIGGAAPGAGNVISGNFYGVAIGNDTVANNVVQGNLIGTDASGTNPLGNFYDGISLNSAPTTIIDGNVIAASGGAGIYVENFGSDDIVIRSNEIGTDASGTVAMGNAFGIVVSYSASGAPKDTTIGGSGVGNLIAHNTGPGVTIVSGIASNSGMFVSPTGVVLEENAIFANGGLGIDLENDGISANDAGDVDGGANGLQNFPVVTGVDTSVDPAEFTGTLDSSPSTTFRIEIFKSTAGDPSGNGEGQRSLGSTMATTDGAGHATFDVFLSATLAPGDVVTATATDPGKNTSEFSPAFVVGGGTTTSSTVTSTTTTTSSTTTPSTSTTSTTSSTGLPTTATTASVTTSSTTTSTKQPTVTTLAGSTTTSTTLAPGLCAGVPDTPSFQLISCRLAELNAETTEAANELGGIQKTLLARLFAGADGLDRARAQCGAGKNGPTRRTLGRVAKQFRRFAKLLDSKKASSVPASLRTALGGKADALRSLALAFKGQLSCPADAS